METEDTTTSIATGLPEKARIEGPITPYQSFRHRRTGERYVSIGMGQMKTGPSGEPLTGWTTCVVYTRRAVPTAYFARDEEHFRESFEREPQ